MFYGDLMRDIRFEYDVKQKDMAKILGLAKNTYSSYENQYVIIPLKYLIGFCNYFEISLDYILGFSKEMYVNQKIDLNAKKIGIRLRKIRNKKHISQKDLASKLNITGGLLSSYETGRCLISTNALYTFCKIFGVSADYIVGIREDENLIEQVKSKS